MHKRPSAICIDNTGYETSLVMRKVYDVLPDDKAGKDDLVRAVDESGEDYLYHRSQFILVDLPSEVARALTAV